MKKIVLTGGGTAGHVMPNIALLPNLRKSFKEIHYITSENGIENNILKDYDDVIVHKIKTCKLIRSLNLKNLLIPFKLLKSINDAKKILKEIKPNIIFSKGGYVSVPVVLAAKKLKIPVISHESDISMGLSNKIIYKYCKYLCTTFIETNKKHKKCILTGNPIREEIFNGNKEIAKKICNFKNNKNVLMIFGGSLGAKYLNNFIWNNLEEITKKYNIIHIVGKNNLKNVKNSSYCQMEFTNKIQDFFSYADIIMCRGGSNSIHELLALKKLMLIIPLPKDESRGDQIENAISFYNSGYCEYLLQENLNLKNFNNKTELLLKNKKIFLSNMNKSNKLNANQKIVKIINDNLV